MIRSNDKVKRCLPGVSANGRGLRMALQLKIFQFPVVIVSYHPNCVADGYYARFPSVTFSWRLNWLISSSNRTYSSICNTFIIFFCPTLNIPWNFLFWSLVLKNLFLFFSYSLLIGMITMRCLLLFLFHILFLYVGNFHVCLTPSLLLLPPSAGGSYYLNDTNDVPTKEMVLLDNILFILLILISWLILLLYQVWLHVCSNIYYVPFDTNLNIFKKT